MYYARLNGGVWRFFIKITQTNKDMKVKDTINDVKFNEYLGYEIEAYTKLRPAPQKGYKWRRTPYDALNEAGLFTVENIKAEFEKVANLESKLPKAQRDAVVNIVLKAASSVVTYRKQQEEKAANTGQKTEQEPAKEAEPEKKVSNE